MEVVEVCPLGMPDCEYIKDNKLYRCKWYKNYAGQDPMTGEPVDRWDCSINWSPLISADVGKSSRSVAAATESLRNEVVKGYEAGILVPTIIQESRRNRLEGPVSSEGDEFLPETVA